MTPDERRSVNQDTLRVMLDAFNSGDHAGLLCHCDDDIVYEAPYFVDMADRHGRASMAAMLGAVDERFDRLSYQVVAVVDALDPDLVIAEVRGDHPVRNTDRRYQNHYVMFLEFRDGLVVRWREFSNPDEYRRAVLGR